MGHKNDLTSKGKFLALILRHQPEKANISLDKHGWANVNDIIKNVKFLSKEDLDNIVESDSKNRYEYSDFKLKIRARQGHSVPVNLELKEVKPPDILYHGTATRFLESIYDKGIIKGCRQYVHLSSTIETATKVGERHGTPYILNIDAKQMYEDGIKFYLSSNNVWLTDYISPKYIVTLMS